MPSTYTPSLRLTLPSTGDLVGTWGVTVNSGITNLTDQAIAGTASITMTADTTYVLSNLNGQSDEARNMFINVGGGTHTVTTNVVCPAVSKLYYVYNGTTGGQDIVFKTASGSGVTIPNGQRISLYCDGTDVVAAANNTPSVGSITPAMLSTGGPSWNSSGILTAGSGLSASGIVSAQLSTPSAPTGTISTTGGSLAAATYYIKIVAFDGTGASTDASPQTSFTISIITSKISLSWTPVAHAAAYYILMGTSSNGQDSYVEVGGDVTSYEFTSTTPFSTNPYTPVGGETVNSTGSALVSGNLVTTGSFAMLDLLNAGPSYGIDIGSASADYTNVSLTTGSTLGLSLRVYGAGHTTPDQIQFYSETTGPMSFYTDSTERLKIDASGNIIKVGAGDIQLSGTSKVTNSGSGGFESSGSGSIKSSSSGKILSTGSGNIETSGTGKILSSGTANIESSGSGGIISSGSGNIESTGSGNIVANGTGFLGYGGAAGAWVQQLTSKSTAVTINTYTGHIYTNNATLNANTSVAFTVSNSKCSSSTSIIANVIGNANYSVIINNITTGSFSVRLTNLTASNLSDTVTILFTIIKGDF